MDRYSQFVVWLKVILPLIALGILSTLFLLGRGGDPDPIIPFAEAEIQDRLRDRLVSGPIYQSLTADGDELAFRAAKLTSPPSQTGANEAEEIEITMNLTSGTTVTVTALNGRLDMAADRTDLRGDVVITTSSGYRLTSDWMHTAIAALDVTSPGPVVGTAPLGTLNAGAMRLSSGDAPESGRLVFTDGVKLVYHPGQVKE